MNKYKGLTSEEVNLRIKQNKINKDVKVKINTVPQIIIKNILTPFNLLNFFLASLLIFVKEYKNLLFLGVVIINTIISTIHEVTAKKITEKLSILKKQKVICIRDNKEQLIDSEHIVIDDILCFSNSNVVLTDVLILDGEVLVNESLITGEEDNIKKKKGDILFSGSNIVSGKVITKATSVGKDNYANKIIIESKYIKKNNSEIINSINKIVKTMAILIIPLGLLLFLTQYNIINDFSKSITNTVAAIVGMIPKGLVLLVSSVFYLSVVKLSKYNILIKNLYSIENLSRIDTICLDKTGTLTKGNLKLKKVIYLENNKTVDKLINILISNTINFNKTTLAIKEKYNEVHKQYIIKHYNFSSDKKFSGIKTKNYGTILLGAPEVLTSDEDVLKLSYKYSKKYRCLILVHTNTNDNFDTKKINTKNLNSLALILLEDELREDVESIINYLYNQNIDIKIITGDNPITAKKIAEKCGIKNYKKCIDVSKLKNDELLSYIKNNTIFARVSPFEKKYIINYLKKYNKVAYIGDGTNDVMALKESDFSLTFDNASDDAKNVSDTILVNSSFSAIPKIIKEGRNKINNLEKSASLFLIKTFFSLLLTIIFLFIDKPYPFIPIQLTLISTLTIGIPSFFVAFLKNDKSVTGSFLSKIIKNSISPAFTIVIDILLISIISEILNLNYELESTMCVILTGLINLAYFYTICITFNKLKITLYVLSSIFILLVLFFRDLFSLAFIPFNILVIILILFILSIILLNIITNIFDRIFKSKI